MQPRGSIIKNLTKPEQEMCSENYVEYSFSSGFNNKTFSMSDQSNVGNFKSQLPTYSHISSDSSRASSTIENENDNQIMGKF
ncbi:hypothetical protein HELRODRAFT_189060 [Helobdella robusta]|uniref:Uncharacterized protein n=1 Tax=Helobdella robusta TaxID=6412 RepID=T1FQL8_HELRO|nr:hypothetical protein HELRODRAFT_189060 [Helobdella robusta]ESN99465.1 hypothetical protein HELRODRAFT_189060 [Helobdella robusta]